MIDFEVTGFLVYRYSFYSAKEESNYIHLGYPSSDLEN